jgi:pantetheine-phosphate adenylyltransferase
VREAKTFQSKVVRGLYPGSFDPITIAHVSIAERAAQRLDSLYVAVAVSPTKKPEFSIEDRLYFVRASIGHIANAQAIVLKEGLTVDHARELGASILVRGARSVTDFLDEIELYKQNIFVQHAVGIDPEDDRFVDTQTYYTLPNQDHIASSLVRGLMHMPGDFDRAKMIQPLVPAAVYEAVLTRLHQND